MADKADERSARENRQRLFREEGARAMEDATNNAIAIRKNMARLRELRLAKEAEAAASDGVTSKTPVKTSNRKRIIRK
jgi:hypothetical protein